MWLIKSSIGRKVVMSVTGIALILFLTFHGCMNVVALFSGEAYNTICELLGANWYAVAATLGLAALAVCHIVYAFILTAQNRRARGSERYAVTDKPAKVEWASQNMLVLGIIILLGLILHLFNFWYNMMFAELFPNLVTPMVNAAGENIKPSDGFEFIKVTFANPCFASRLLECIADSGLERQDMVLPLEAYRSDLRHPAHAHVPGGCSGLRVRLCALALCRQLLRLTFYPKHVYK